MVKYCNDLVNSGPSTQSLSNFIWIYSQMTPSNLYPTFFVVNPIVCVFFHKIFHNDIMGSFFPHFPLFCSSSSLYVPSLWGPVKGKTESLVEGRRRKMDGKYVNKRNPMSFSKEGYLCHYEKLWKQIPGNFRLTTGKYLFERRLKNLTTFGLIK